MSSTIPDGFSWSFCLKSYYSHPSQYAIFVSEGKFSFIRQKVNICFQYMFEKLNWLKWSKVEQNMID